MSSNSNNTICLKELNPTINEGILRGMFSSYGPILKINIVKDESKSETLAFIEYESKEASVKAVSEMNGKIIMKKPVKIEIAKPTGAFVLDKQAIGEAVYPIAFEQYGQELAPKLTGMVVDSIMLTFMKESIDEPENQINEIIQSMDALYYLLNTAFMKLYEE